MLEFKVTSILYRLKLWEASTKSHKDKCLKKRYLCEKHFKNFQIRKHRIKNVLGPLTVPNEEISEEEYRCKVETFIYNKRRAFNKSTYANKKTKGE